MKKRKLKRTILIAVIAAAALYGLNELMSFPLAFRAGDPEKWLGPGPAGPPRERAYRLLAEDPVKKVAPFEQAMRDELAGLPVLAEGSPYGLSATLGTHKHWESNRHVILSPAPAEVAYRITVPAGAQLTFGYAVKAPKKKARPGARFIVEWEGAAGRKRLFEDTVVPAPPGFWEKTEDRERLYYRYLFPAFTRRGDLFRDAEVDLAALAGETGTLHFITELASASQDEDHAWSLWANPEIWALRPAGKEPPVNVLFFMIEATPTTMVQPFTSQPAVTPNLKALAEQGVAFDKFFTVGDSTQLSTFSFFTGLHYQRMGLPNEIYYLAPLVKARFYRNRFATLPESFSRMGYKTAQFGTNHYFLPTREFGLDLGFDQLEIQGRRNYAHIDTTLAALEWLRQNGDKPFFLYVHYDAPHDEEKPDLAVLARALLAGGKDWRWRYRKYLAQVIRSDRDFGKFVQALDTLGVRGRTLIVVTSDHGNCVMPEHTFAVLRPDRRPWWTPFQHGRAMSAEDINPPLIMAGPGVRRAGAIDHTPLASVDLFPTLQNMVPTDTLENLPLPIGTLDAKSFAGLLDPASQKNARGHQVIYSISQGGEAAVMDGRWHYVRRAAGFDKLLYPGADLLTVVREELHDLAADPRELTNLAAAEPEMLERMRAALTAARPPESRLRLLYLNYPKGRVRGRIALHAPGGRVSPPLTFPEGRRPVAFWPVEVVSGDTSIFSFDYELNGPTGLALEDQVEWVEIVHGNTALSPSALRLGPFGLPLLAEAAAGSRFDLESNPVLAASALLAARHPSFYMSEPGVYYYQMSFSDFVAGTFSDEELSPEVRSILKQWGYIE